MKRNVASGSNRQFAHRRLVLVDIENLCGTPVLTEQGVAEARAALDAAIGLGRGDLVVIGASHSNNILTAGFAWRGPRLVFDRGRDGAERALLRALGDYDVAGFGEVVISSGDGIFSEAAEALALETVVTAVYLPGALHWRLYRAVDEAIAA